jgi:hypothetical protein
MTAQAVSKSRSCVLHIGTTPIGNNILEQLRRSDLITGEETAREAAFTVETRPLCPRLMNEGIAFARIVGERYVWSIISECENAALPSTRF